MTFKKINTFLGWILFFISFYIFISTVEPVLSFWDCGEYIASSVKLEIGHAPGAPTFQLLGSLFSLFALGDSTKYALILNIESAICSSLTILFLFWTITHFSCKIIFNKNFTDKNFQINFNQKVIVFGSGIIGSMSFMFSDTFWFSSVEAEVYSMASLFTAIIFWLMCRWERDKNVNYSYRWILLICFIIGLSVGVHFIVLLTIPALGLIYYYNKYPFNIKSFFLAHIIILIIFLFYFKVIFPLTIILFGYNEIFFVNILKFPFNSGTIFSFILFLSTFFFLIYYTHKKKFVFLNIIVLCIFYSLIGFSSWILIPIRASTNTPINLNNPNNAITMHDYYTRHIQYGDCPIIYGQMYTAYLDKNGIIGYKLQKPIYEKDKKSGKYIIITQEISYKFNPKHLGIFPRMYSDLPEVINNYQAIVGKPKIYIEKDFKTGYKIIHYQKPTFFQNILFFINYQVGYMFLRYLFWNYVGRQNDFHGNYEVTKGNWLSGISFIDNIHLGSQKNVPKCFYNNKANNIYYGLPLFFGIIGIIFQIRKKIKDFYVLLSIFLLTSIGIIIYTNVKPFEPRERDYILVNSFYIFAIWIGLGVIGIFNFFKKIYNHLNIFFFIFIIFVIVPLRMGEQNWDDHDRSYRTFPRDIAQNYLDSMKNQAIFFVFGDNDTYPLWSLQETENYRDDIRIINYNLLASSWNIDQIQRKINNSLPINITLNHNQYRQGNRDTILVFSSDKIITIQEAMKWLSRDDKKKEEIKKKIFLETNKKIDFLPTNKISIPINKSLIIKNKILPLKESNKIVSNIILELPVKKNQPYLLNKNDLIFLDMLSNYKWDRPIYFSVGGIYDINNTFHLNKYLQYMGFYYKLVPMVTLENTKKEIGYINSEEMYKIIKKFHWGNLKDPRGYIDYNGRLNIIIYQNAVNRTSKVLINENKQKKAQEILDKLEKEIPQKFYEENLPLIDIATSYIRIKQINKAKKIIQKFHKNLIEEINYYLELSPKYKYWINNDMIYSIYKYNFLSNEIIKVFLETNNLKFALFYAEQFYKRINIFLEKLVKKTRNLPNNYLYSQDLKLLFNIHQNLISILEKINPFLAKYYEDKFFIKFIN